MRCRNSVETDFCICVKKWQKWAYTADYLRTDLDQIFSFDRYMDGDD